MVEQKFGGDDDKGGSDRNASQTKKKLPLYKFSLAPDTNIRDLFWKIMGSYATAKTMGVDLSTIKSDRFALMHAALSVLRGQHHHGLTPKFIALYSLIMIIDGGWNDIWFEFLGRAKMEDKKTTNYLINGLKKLLISEKYKEQLKDWFSLMLRNKNSDNVALFYLAEIKNVEISQALKKELIILARGGIGEDQINAINAISLLKDDETKKTFIVLLSHWDVEARLAAANGLGTFGNDNDIKSAVINRIPLETNEGIKKILKRLVNDRNN